MVDGCLEPFVDVLRVVRFAVDFVFDITAAEQQLAVVSYYKTEVRTIQLLLDNQFTVVEYSLVLIVS